MSAPKSVVKMNKNGVEFTSNVDACEYYLFELTRAALRDVVKFVRRTFKDEFYKNFKKHSGDAGRATYAVVLSGRNTKYPRAEVGLKKGQVDGFYAFFQEFGARGGAIPEKGILRHAVNDNIEIITKIESQYLSAIDSGDAKINSLISEEEYNGDGDEI